MRMPPSQPVGGSPSGLVILPNTAPLLTLLLSNSNNWLRSCVRPRPGVPRNTIGKRTPRVECRRRTTCQRRADVIANTGGVPHCWDPSGIVAGGNHKSHCANSPAA